MLKHPSTDLPYNPQVSHLLCGIEIYDREETLGEELWRYNPNDEKDREEIIKNYILPAIENISYRHRFVLYNVLKEALENSNFDFSELFETDYDSDDYTCTAWDSSEIENPKGFFIEIFEFITNRWADDLNRAASEDESSW